MIIQIGSIHFQYSLVYSLLCTRVCFTITLVTFRFLNVVYNMFIQSAEVYKNKTNMRVVHGHTEFMYLNFNSKDNGDTQTKT